MDLRTRLMIFRAGILLRRANRRRRRVLRAELAGYSSQADVDDFCALLDAHPDGQTWELRDILAGQQIRRLQSH
jgi:hypothetical protein